MIMYLETLEKYFRYVDLSRLLEELNASNIELILREVRYFSEREAEARDEIVLSYFGEDGVKRITDSIVNYLLSYPILRRNAKILDVGAGSGFFTIKVVNQLRHHMPEASFYAMDITPIMLQTLMRKNPVIIPFLGIAENIPGSIEHARKHLGFLIPERFNAIFSTLTLHHCLNVENVFSSIRKALVDEGKAIVIDLCEHSFKEFKEEMGDVHLGFNPSFIKEVAKKFFSTVHVTKIPGVCCKSSGRSAELFIASMECK